MATLLKDSTRDGLGTDGQVDGQEVSVQVRIVNVTDLPDKNNPGRNILVELELYVTKQNEERTRHFGTRSLSLDAAQVKVLQSIMAAHRGQYVPVLCHPFRFAIQRRSQIDNYRWYLVRTDRLELSYSPNRYCGPLDFEVSLQ